MEEQAQWDLAKESVFFEKLGEVVRGTYVGGHQWQGQKILELNSTIKQLRKERDSMVERADRMESAKSELQMFEGLDEGSWEQREVLEASIKDVETRSSELWQKVLEL